MSKKTDLLDKIQDKKADIKEMIVDLNVLSAMVRIETLNSSDATIMYNKILKRILK